MIGEKVTEKQAISAIALYVCGSSLMFDVAIAAKEDIWLAIILSFAAALAAAMMYATILSKYNNKNLFDICIIVFGKWIGSFFCLLYSFFSLHLASLVLFDYIEFMSLIGLNETPKIVSMVCMAALILWIMKEGMGVLGQWCELFVVINFLLVFIGLALFFPLIDIKNIKPFLSNGIQLVMEGAAATFTFPFAETVLFMGLFSELKNKKSPYKIYSIGLSLGAIIIFASSVIHMLALGPNEMLRIYFPPYNAFRLVKIGEFLTRIEIIIGVGFLIGGFAKSAICLVVSCKGLCRVFSINSYKIIVTPICIITIIMTITDFNNIAELLEWDKAVWKWYAAFFEVCLPIIILISAEIKSRREYKLKEVS